MNFFITKNFSKKIDKKANLILSPEFYWVKRVSLDIRFSSEIKSMAESIFDSCLPSGEFEYRVFKLAKKEYVIVAYDLRYIKKELEILDIRADFINKIYLAQSEFSNLNLSFDVDEQFGIASSDGVVLYLPKELLDDDTVDMDEYLKRKKLSSKYIYSKMFDNKKFNTKWLNLLLLVSILCIAVSVVEIFRFNQKMKRLDEIKSSILLKNSLPNSSFELKSILNEMTSIEKKKSALRDSIGYLASFPLKKDEYFESLEFKGNRLGYRIKLSNEKREKEFVKYISKKRNSTIKIEQIR